MAELEKKSSWKNIGTNRMSDSRHYSGIKSEPTQSEWETVFNAHESRVNPHCVSEKCRSLIGAPMAKIMREGIFWDENRDPPEDDPYTIREFLRGLHTRAGVSGGAAAATFLNRLNTWCIEGFQEIQDSLDDVADTHELSNYLPAPVVQALDRHSLSPIPRGGTAEDTELTILDLGRWAYPELASGLLSMNRILSAMPRARLGTYRTIGPGRKAKLA